MDMNVTFLKVTGRASGYVDVEITTREMQVKFDAEIARKKQNNERIYSDELRPHQYTLTIAEAQFAVQCLRGGAAFNPIFDDLNHQIKFGSNGAKVIDFEGMSGGWSRAETYYCNFPGTMLAGKLDTAAAQARMLKDNAEFEKTYEARGASWSYTFSDETLSGARATYAPRIRFEFADFGRGNAAKKYMEALHHPLVVNGKADGKRASLKQQMQGLAHIAKNNSDGDLVTIHVSLDNENDPASFYWWIEKGGKQYMNGGIIAHPLRDKVEGEDDYYRWPIVGYEYSTHT